MRIRVLFFGLTADLVGRRQIEFDLTETFRTKNILDRVIEEHPALASHQLRFSVNQEYASGEQILNDGDEVAVFTAVSGG